MARGSITQRGDSFRVRVDYYDLNGRRRQVSKTAPSFRQAELLSTKLQAEVDRGGFLKPSKIKVEAFLNQWLDGYVKSTVSGATLELYSNLSRKHLIPALGNILLEKLRPQHIQTLYADKLQQGLAPRTVQLIHVCLHKALSNAIKTGILSHNPIDGVEQPRVERRSMKTMTEDNITQFLNKAHETEYYALFFTYLFTGLRRGEALSLRWSDIDLLGAQLSVSRTMQFLHNEITFKQPKTASSCRQIALSPSTCVVLRVHREEQDRIRQYRGLSPAGDNDLVFCHSDGTPYLPRTISHCWDKLTHRCGLDGIRLHDARHSHATLMLKNGTSPKVIQERLGHSSFSTTMNLYAHVSPGMQKQAVDKFDEMMQTPQAIKS